MEIDYEDLANQLDDLFKKVSHNLESTDTPNLADGLIDLQNLLNDTPIDILLSRCYELNQTDRTTLQKNINGVLTIIKSED